MASPVAAPAPAARRRAVVRPLTDMWFGEATICVCTVYNLGRAISDKVTWEGAAVDVFPLAMITLVGLMCEHSVRDVPSYRQSPTQGLLIGCLTVPALIAGIMLREIGDGNRYRYHVLAWYLRIAISASGLAAGSGVAGWATRPRSYIKFALLAMLLAYMCSARVTEVPLYASLATLIAADGLNRALLHWCARSFTLGEATVISTGFALLGTDTVAQVVAAVYGRPNVFSREVLPVDCVVQALVVGTLLTCLALWPWVASQQQLGRRALDEALGVKVLRKADLAASKKDHDAPHPKDKAAEGGKGGGKGAGVGAGGVGAGDHRGGVRAFMFSLALAAVVGFVCMPAATLLVKEHMLSWVWAHVVASDERLRLLAYWGLVLLATLAVYPPRGLTVPRIVLRKGYHIIAMALFAPGQMLQPETMRLAYAAAFALLVTLELARAARIGRAADAMHRAMAPLLDERDKGTLVLTHIYLLVGCAAPSLLCAGGRAGGRGAALLLPYAGLLIVGAGDTVASVIGTYFGRTHWVQNERKGKTMEGTAAGWVCTVCAAWALMAHTGEDVSTKAYSYVAIATAGACLLEAFTQQIDNLVLPLWYFAMLLLAATHQ